MKGLCKMKIVVAGGTGLIGKSLLNRLISTGHKVTLLTRNPGIVNKGEIALHKLQWDGKTIGSWSESIDGAVAVINLCGENVASKRWTRDQKIKLLDSRIDPTRVLIKAISEAGKKPSLLINASAAGFYGNYGTGEVTEDDGKGDGFLADLCDKWEQEGSCAEKYGTRVVFLRFGVVLDTSGGALKKMLPPFRMFVGGPLGTGKQWFSWIHCDDAVNVIHFALQNPQVIGPINVVAPSPITMSEFASSLGKLLERPSGLHVPSFILKLGLGEMSGMLIGGRKIIPKKLLDNKFVFSYPDIDRALTSLLKKNH